MSRVDGRRFVREVAAEVRVDGERTLVLAPMPGLYRSLPTLGARVIPGGVIAEIEVLGRITRLIAPAGAQGIVVAHPKGPRRARVPLPHGAVVLTLDLNVVGAAQAAGEHAIGAAAATGLVFKTPLGGRYYARPSPGAEAFVKVGDELKAGTTLAIVEVMKTFNRVQYGGAMLPERARVLRIVPKDGDDVTAGDALVEIEAI